MKIFVPKGFLFAGVHCGIKKKKKDLGIAFSQAGCKTAGVFTTNSLKGAPLIVTAKKISGTSRMLVVNSGVANACTGKKGMKNAEETCGIAAKETGLNEKQVLVASTGIIGKQLPMQKIKEGIKQALEKLSPKGVFGFSEAILTTDTKTKTASAKINVNGKAVSLLGIAKGSGMVSPNMATTLAFVFTDAAISRAALSASLKKAVCPTFNAICIDGDTSPNDCIIAMANGKAGNHSIAKNCKSFDNALHDVLLALAKAVVEDGEGASKTIEVTVSKAASNADAEKAAKAIVSSTLVKTAVFGGDPNWGRILTALGYSGAKTDFNAVRLALNEVVLFDRGKPTGFEKKAALKLKEKTARIDVVLNSGKSSAKTWGCDLTPEYVKLNSRYST